MVLTPVMPAVPGAEEGRRGKVQGMAYRELKARMSGFMRFCFKIRKILSNKRARVVASWHGACTACPKSWVRAPAPGNHGMVISICKVEAGGSEMLLLVI